MSGFKRLSIYHNFSYYSESLTTSETGVIKIPLQKTVNAGYINVYHLKDDQLHPLVFVYHTPHYSNPDKTDAIVIDEDGNQYEGKYVNHSDRAVTIAKGDTERQIISGYRSLTLKNVNNESNPYLSIDLTTISKPTTTESKTLIVEVILDGINWVPKYKMVIKEEDDSVNNMSEIPVFQLIAEIDNSTDHDFDIDLLELVAGNVNKPTQPRYKQAAMLRSADVNVQYESASQPIVNDSNISADSFQELHRYQYGTENGMTLENGKSVIPLVVSKITARKLYYANFGNSSQSKLTVRYGYNFNVEDTFLPEGEAMVYSYKQDYAKESNPIGSVHVPETQPHREVNLIIGSTNRVQIKNKSQIRTERGYDVLPDVVPIKSTNLKDAINKLDNVSAAEKDKLTAELMAKLQVKSIEKVYYDHMLNITNDTKNNILMRLSFYLPAGTVENIEFSTQKPNITLQKQESEDGLINYFVQIQPTSGENGYAVGLKYIEVNSI